MYTNNKQRITYIDLAKGLCMILVVYFHVKDNFYHIAMPFDSTIRMFHMPLFFVLSGMFFNGWIDLKKFVVKKTNTLLIPFAFFYLTTAILLPYVLLWLGWSFSVEGGIGWHSLYIQKCL